MSACSSEGEGEARQACQHVLTSLRYYRASLRATGPSAQRDLNLAYAQLRQALPLAAAANSANGQYNALMTTISESARVSESHLVVALEAQCSATDANQPYPNAPSGGT